MDLDALREALERYEQHKGFLWQRLPHDDWAAIDRSFAAARAVLDSEEAWWCEVHSQAAVPPDVEDSEPAVECAGAFLGWWDDCSMVRVRLLAEEKL